MSLLSNVLSDINARQRSEEVAKSRNIEERRRWEDDPARPSRLLSHLQRFSVPDKKREKLGADATLEKVEAAIPEGDPRKGMGLEALNLARRIMPEAPRDAHPQDILEGVFSRLSAERSEATNRYVQKEESGLFGKRDIAKPEGYEAWKGEFLKENAPKMEWSNPVVSALLGGGMAAAGAGAKRLLATEGGAAGNISRILTAEKRNLAGDVISKGGEILTESPTLSKILPTGERVATKAFVNEGLGLTNLGHAASKIPFAGEKIAQWALKKGGASIGTKILGRLMMAAPPVGPVGIGMKIAGAALLAIPEFAMFDLATFGVKSAAPEWSAQRETLSGLAGGALAVPGIMALNKTLGKVLASKAAVDTTSKKLLTNPSGDNILLAWDSQKAAAKAEDQHLIGYRRLLDDKGERFVTRPPSGVAQEGFMPGGTVLPPEPVLHPEATVSGMTAQEGGLTLKGLPLPESLQGKILGEGFVSQDLVNTHIYNYKSMLKDFTDEIISSGTAPGEALTSARQTVKRGIGLELINSASGDLVSSMPVKMRMIGPYGVESVFREVAENGTELSRAVDNALFVNRHFGKDIFKQQATGVEAVAKDRIIGESANSFASMADESSPLRLAQKHGLEFKGTMDYSEYGQGKIHYFNDPQAKNTTIAVKSMEDLERTVTDTRAAFKAAEKTDVGRATMAQELDANIEKTAQEFPPISQGLKTGASEKSAQALGEKLAAVVNKETSKIDLSGLDRVKAARGLKVTPDEAKILEDKASAIDDEIAILRKKKSPDTTLIKQLESQRDSLTAKATPGIEEMFSKQPETAVLKGEITTEMHSSLDKKMDLYRKNPSALSDEDFAIMHNAESTSWHTSESTKRYKEIIDAKRAAIPANLDSLAGQIISDLGEVKAGKIFEKAGKSAKALKPEEVNFLKDGGLSDEDIKVKILHEVTKNKYLNLLLGGLIAGGTMVSLPDDVYAGAPDLAGRTVLKAAMDGAKGIKGGIMNFAKKLEEHGMLSPKISADGLRVENYQKPFIVPADPTAITRKKRLPFSLDRILSPYTLGQIYYTGTKEGLETMSNPAVGIASAQTAAENNTQSSLKVFYNIMKTFGIKPAFKEVKTGMAELSKEYQPIISEAAAHYEQSSMLKSTIDKANKSLAKTTGDEAKEIIDEIHDLYARLDVHKKAIEASKEKIAAYHTSYNSQIKDLANKHSSVRVTLLMEEQEGKQSLYPWLKDIAQPNEYNAAARMKEMMGEYAGRMREVGQDPITYKGYVHYAAHPDVDWKAIQKTIEGIESGASSTPSLYKFYERSIGGRNMMPDIFYSMEKYLPDANKRIAFGDFWGKGKKNSWYAHANSNLVQMNDGLRTFWDTVNRNFQPFDSTPLARLADRIQAFEVGRLLSFSPSVSFKHAIKLEATWSNMGWIESMKAMPETSAMWARRMTPEWAKKTPSLEDQVVKTFINQGSMARTVADMETVNIPKNLWDKATTWMNEKGAIMVNSVENFDRAHSMVAAGMMASKQGMTASQAAYGVMDSILKNNFLTGALNPSWLRDPKVRLLFMFQGTPFKIAEQRAINLWRSGKAVRRAAGETVELFKSLRGDIKEGEFILKAHAIKDALVSEKDIWGTPLVQQTMRKIIVLGSMIATGKYAFDSDLWNHVIHAPFFEFGKGDVSIRLNPATSAAYKTWQEKGDEGKNDWMAVDFMKNWIKDPFVQNNIIKAMRLSKGDIPEIYKDSRVRYMLSVPGHEGD